MAARSLKRFVLVGHSMGGKIAQMLAIRGLPGLAGLVQVAPAPPSPMPVPPEVRAGMLASYGSAEGVAQALGVLTNKPLSGADRALVIEDTLRGAPDAKRAWTDTGIIADLGPGLHRFTGPATIVVGSADRVEDASRLRRIYAQQLPQAQLRIIEGAGHLSPLEAPDALADACRGLVSRIGG